MSNSASLKLLPKAKFSPATKKAPFFMQICLVTAQVGWSEIFFKKLRIVMHFSSNSRNCTCSAGGRPSERAREPHSHSVRFLISQALAEVQKAEPENNVPSPSPPRRKLFHWRRWRMLLPGYMATYIPSSLILFPHT